MRRTPLLTLAILLACDGRPQHDALAPVLTDRPDRVVISADLELNRQASRPQQGLLIFEGAGAARLGPGMIMADTQNGGFLQKVVGVRRVGAEYHVSSVPATLNEAIHDGTLQLQERVDLRSVVNAPANTLPFGRNLTVVSSSIPGVTFSNGEVSFTNIPLLQSDRGTVILEQGSIKLDPVLDVDLKARFSAGRIDSLRLTATSVATIDADVVISTSRSVINDKLDINVFTLNKWFFATVGGFPVIGRLTTRFNVVGGLDVRGRLAMRTGFRSTAGFTAGALYGRAPGEEQGTWTNLTSGFGPTFTLRDWETSANLTAEVRVSLKAETEVILYEMAGPHVYAEPYVEMSRTIDTDAGTMRDKGEFGIDVGAYLYANIFGLEFAVNEISDTFAQHVFLDEVHVFQRQPGTLSLTSGNGQVGTPGTQLVDPFVITYKRGALPAVGEAVTFTILGGGGTLSSTTVNTDANGRASTYLTLGADAATNTVSASIDGASGSPIIFAAIGVLTGGTITGRVTDELVGAAVAGAIVEVAQADQIVATAHTDSRGYYRTPRVSPGSYLVSARSHAHSTRTYLVPVTTAGGVRNFRLPPLPAAAALGGVVRNSVGNQPITGAVVKLWSWVGGRRKALIATDTTKPASPGRAAGGYVFPIVQSGTYALIVTAPWHNKAEYTGVVVAPHTSNVHDVVMVPEVRRIDVEPDTTSVPLGGTVQFSATVYDRFDNTLTNRSVTWTATSPWTSVNGTGLVTGLIGKQDPVRISARSEGRTGEGFVSVIPPDSLRIASILPADTPKVSAGESVTYTLRVEDPHGNVVASAQIDGTDGLKGQALGSLLTNTSGEVQYTSTVPVGKAPGIYPISFTASKSGYSTSQTVTRRVEVEESGGVIVDTIFSAADVTLANETPTTNLGTFGEGPRGALVVGANMNIWSGGPNNLQYASLLKFDVSSLPAGAEILNADIRLRFKTRSGSGTIRIYQVTSAWTEGGATWNNQPTKAPTAILEYLSGSCATCTLNLNSTVQAWVDGSVTNHGLYLFAPNSATATYTVGYARRHDPNVVNRPQLIVTYRVP